MTVGRHLAGSVWPTRHAFTWPFDLARIARFRVSESYPTPTAA